MPWIQNLPKLVISAVIFVFESAMTLEDGLQMIHDFEEKITNEEFIPTVLGYDIQPSISTIFISHFFTILEYFENLGKFPTKTSWNFGKRIFVGAWELHQ